MQICSSYYLSALLKCFAPTITRHITYCSVSQPVVRGTRKIERGDGPRSTIMIEKPEGKRPLGGPRCRWNVIRMGLREIGFECVDWIHVAQDRGR
jgi:hypothetical protein